MVAPVAMEERESTNGEGHGDHAGFKKEVMNNIDSKERQAA